MRRLHAQKVVDGAHAGAVRGTYLLTFAQDFYPTPNNAYYMIRLFCPFIINMIM